MVGLIQKLLFDMTESSAAMFAARRVLCWTDVPSRAADRSPRTSARTALASSGKRERNWRN